MRRGLMLLIVATGVGLGPGASRAAWAQQEAAGPEAAGPEAAEAYSRAAQAQRNNAFDLAADEWRSFLTRHPKDPLAPRAHYYLGVCRMQLKQLDGAIEAFRQMLREAPDHELAEDARLNLGWTLFTVGKDDRPEQLEQASVAFAELMTRHPQGKYADQALFFQAEANYALGKREQAIPHYRRLLKDHADSRFAVDASYALGVALEETKQYAEAGLAYDEFLQRHADHELAREIRMRKAETLLQAGQAEAAELLFAEAAALPEFAMADHALMRQAACRVLLGQDAEAAELFVSLPLRFPQSAHAAEASLQAGRSLFRLRRDAEALPWLKQSWEQHQNHEAAHWLARLHLRNHRLSEAEALAKQAAASASDEDQARLWLDEADAIYADPQRRSEALRLYLEMVRQRPAGELAPQAMYNAAFAAMELQRYEEAIQLANQFAELAPPGHELAPDSRYVLAESLLQRKQYPEAANILAKLVADHAEHPQRDSWALRRAWALYLPQDYAGVISHLQPIADSLAAPEAQAEARYLLGSSQFLLDQFPAARSELEQSLQLAPTGPRAAEARLLLSRALHRLGEVDNAIAAAERVVAEHADSGLLDQANYRLGEYLFGAERFSEAESAYARSLDAAHDGTFAPFALHGRAWSQIKSQRLAEAVETLTGFLERFPDHALAAEARFGRALARRQVGDPEQALAELTELSKSGPRQADALYEQGLALAALQRFDEACEAFRKLLDDHPDYAAADKARYELGWTLKTAKQDAAAAEAFAALVDKHPQSPLAAEAWYHVGQHRYDAQQYPQAALAYEKAATEAATDDLKEKSLYKLGWARFQQRNYGDAESAFSQQADLGTELGLHADACFMRGECAFQAEDYPRAHALFQELLQASRKPPSETAQVLLLLHAGQAAAQAKQWDASIAALKGLLEQHADSLYSPEARVELGWALHNLGRHTEALQQFAQSSARGALAARADFLAGETHFAAKDFAEAIKQFRKVMFLYDSKAAPDVAPWQAQAGFEAARCAEVQMGAAADDASRKESLANARTFYRYVVENHAQSSFATKAQERLKQLEKL